MQPPTIISTMSMLIESVSELRLVQPVHAVQAVHAAVQAVHAEVQAVHAEVQAVHAKVGVVRTLSSAGGAVQAVHPFSAPCRPSRTVTRACIQGAVCGGRWL